MRKLITYFAILLVSLVLTQTAFADVKIKIRQTMSGQTYENTTYIKGKRQRDERNMGGVESVNITQCDLKRSIQIMPASQAYLVNTWADAENVAPTTTTSVTKTQTPGQSKTGGVITTTYTIKDTGERKQMFGYTARHLIITMETESSPDACSPMKSKMQTDGWYIDAEFALDCDNGNYAGYRPNGGKTGCQDRFVMKQNGTGKRGYPVYEKMTMFDESGKETYSFTNEVVELSTTTLEAALFDVPSGYREVKNASELYASMAGKTSGSGAENNANSNLPTGDSEYTPNSQNVSNKTQTVPAEVGAKKEGIVRIGLANVKVGSVAEGMNPEALAQVIQNTFGEYVKSSQVELVQLEGKLPSAVDDEAKQKECDYIVFANASYKKGGGGFGMFGKMVGNVVAQTGGGNWGNTTANVAGAVAANTIVAATLAKDVKSKDELSLDLKVQPTGSSNAVLTKQYKAKAKSDGDDIITNVVEQASQSIVSTVAAK